MQRLVAAKPSLLYGLYHTYADGCGRCALLAPTRQVRPQLCLAGILGSLLQDGDSWLYLLGPNYYGLYHRVASHSWLGLACIGTLAGVLAWQVSRVKAWRRFGWFVHPNLPQALELPRASLKRNLAVAVLAAYVHWCADAITGFGNVQPFWPWSRWDASLHAVMSFDVVIFVVTFTWHVTTRVLDTSRREEAALGLSYMSLLVVYVLVRWSSGARTFI